MDIGLIIVLVEGLILLAVGGFLIYGLNVGRKYFKDGK